MKTIGLIGGLTWLSTAEYYRLLNTMVQEQRGGSHSAKIILYSVDFEEIKNLTFADDWAGISQVICGIAKQLQTAGADCLLIGANTMHRIAPEVQAAVQIPVLHIAAATAKTIRAQGFKKVALLGTRYTMELGFYQEKLAEAGITTIIPEDDDRQYVHDAIYQEMGKNVFLSSTRDQFIRIIEKLAAAGAEGVILGCTEIPLLLQQKDSPLPVFDTTAIHANAGVAFALS